MEEPMLFGAYGEGDNRPQFNSTDYSIMTFGGGDGPPYTDYIVFLELYFSMHRRNPAHPEFDPNLLRHHVNWLRGTRGLHFEDTVFQWGELNFSAIDGYPIDNVTFRRCQILDSWAPSTVSHAQGIYLAGVKNITIEETLFDHNGWNPDAIGGKKTVFNHNLYAGDPENLTLKNSVLMRGASHGVQMRTGGFIENNLFVENAISIFFVSRNKNGHVIDNAILNGSDITLSEGRGWGIEISNGGEHVEVSRNIIGHCKGTFCQNVTGDLSNATFSDNIIRNWEGRYSQFAGALKDASRNVESYNELQGGEATIASFAENLRSQSKMNWNKNFEIIEIMDYLREGYNEKIKRDRELYQNKLLQWARLLGIQLAVLIIVLILVELVLLVAFPVAVDKSVSTAYSQNIKGLKKEIVYERNTLGLRSTNKINRVKPDRTIRILCIGASTTDQATQSTEDTWCSLAGEMLQSEYKKSVIRIESASYGRGGIKSTENAAWLYQNIDSLQPDIVVTLLGINDLSWNGGSTYVPSTVDQLIARNDQGFSKLCLELFQLCRRGMAAVRKIQQIRSLASGRVVEWHSDNLPERRAFYRGLPYAEEVKRDPDPLAEFSNAVFWIHDYLSQKGVRLVALGQPVLWNKGMSQAEVNSLWFPLMTKNGGMRVDPGWLQVEMAKYNLVQKQAAGKFGFSFVDLDKILPKNSEIFFDDCHFTDFGSQYIAKSIYPFLKIEVEKSLHESNIK